MIIIFIFIIIFHSVVCSMNFPPPGSELKKISNDNSSELIFDTDQSIQKYEAQAHLTTAVPQELYSHIDNVLGARFCRNSNYIAVLNENGNKRLNIIDSEKKIIKYCFKLPNTEAIVQESITLNSKELSAESTTIHEIVFSCTRQIYAYLAKINEKKMTISSEGCYFKRNFIGYNLIVKNIRQEIQTFPTSISKVDFIDFNKSETHVIIYGQDQNNNNIQQIIDIPFTNQEKSSQNNFAQMVGIIAMANNNWQNN